MSVVTSNIGRPWSSKVRYYYSISGTAACFNFALLQVVNHPGQYPHGVLTAYSLLRITLFSWSQTRCDWTDPYSRILFKKYVNLFYFEKLQDVLRSPLCQQYITPTSPGCVLWLERLRFCTVTAATDIPHQGLVCYRCYVSSELLLHYFSSISSLPPFIFFVLCFAQVVLQDFYLLLLGFRLTINFN